MIKLIRVGGCNLHKYKEKKDKYNFHNPPEHRGLYCFPYHFYEPFLVNWNKQNPKLNIGEKDLKRLVKHKDYQAIRKAYWGLPPKQLYDDLQILSVDKFIQKYKDMDSYRVKPKISVLNYEGYLWGHFIEAAKDLKLGIEYKNSWVKIHSKDYKQVFKKTFNLDLTSIRHWKDRGNSLIYNPYDYMAKDHLEVFITGNKL